eukprot:1137120-Pelagomonas_calceolata.AAC.2
MKPILTKVCSLTTCKTIIEGAEAELMQTRVLSVQGSHPQWACLHTQQERPHNRCQHSALSMQTVTDAHCMKQAEGPCMHTYRFDQKTDATGLGQKQGLKSKSLVKVYDVISHIPPSPQSRNKKCSWGPGGLLQAPSY